MSWLAFVLLLAGSLGRLVDFIVGPRGQRQLKARLADLYVLIAEGDWSDLVRLATEWVDRYLSRWLGSNLLSWKAALRLTAFGIAIDSIAVAVTFIAGYGSLRTPVRILSDPTIARVILVLLASNAFVDSLMFALTRASHRAVLLKPHPSTLRLILADAVIAYLCVALTLLIAMPTTFALEFASPGLPFHHLWWLFFSRLSGFAIFTPLEAHVRLGPANMSLFALSAALPTLLHLGIFILLGTAKVTRPFTQRLITHILERLDDTPNGVFTIIGVFCGAVAALIAALLKALQT